MSAETEASTVMLLDRPARGNIDPQTRIDSGDITEDRVNEVAQSMDRHYVWIGDKLFEVPRIPKWCVDGRHDDEDLDPAANAAGGSYSVVVGDALIDAPALIANNETSATHGLKLFKSLSQQGYDIGGHTDDQAHGEICGCGACDKMGEIFGFIAENIDELSEKAAGLGYDVNESLKSKIKTNAQDLLAANYISTGSEMNKSIREATDDSHSQRLVGSHNEVVLVVNTVNGTTLSRKSLAEEFGKDYEAFNLDVWALENGINAIATSESEAKEKLAASVLYNLATACVLAGPSLRVVVR